MGHHINAIGQFQSDKYPDLAPDKIIISFKDKRTHKGLRQIANDYKGTDSELADDINFRLDHDPLCANCNGEGWVCEDHPEVPWGEECCGGAGMPCSCNELSDKDNT